jgi:hypothetical protein
LDWARGAVPGRVHLVTFQEVMADAAAVVSKLVRDLDASGHRAPTAGLRTEAPDQSLEFRQAGNS